MDVLPFSAADKLLKMKLNFGYGTPDAIYAWCAVTPLFNPGSF